MSVMLPEDFYANEKGNTMLYHEDGSMVTWIKIPGSTKMFEIADTPANTPRFGLCIADYDPVALRAHVLEKLQGWQIERWNLDDHPPVPEGCFLVPTTETTDV